MEELNQIISNYIRTLTSDYRTALLTGNSTPELSFRPALDSFLSHLSQYINTNAVRIFEPRTQGKYGRPDWLFYHKTSMGIFGYVEAKGLDPNNQIDRTSYQAQVQRYLNLGNPVILTDGVDFAFYYPDGSNEIISIIKKPISWDDTDIVNNDIFSRFREFFKEEGYRTISEKQLVSEISSRAKLLCSEIEEILSLEIDEAENEAEKNTIVALKNLWDLASTNHDKALKDNHTFAGFIAQILSFGLLYAHRFINGKRNSPKEKYEQLHAFWLGNKYNAQNIKLSPFKHLVKALSDELESKFSKLGIWYDNTRRLLACVRLSERQVRYPNFHELYEAFLKEYDGKTRSDFGAWYTPMCLADYISRFVKNILPTLSVGSKPLQHAIKIIDPCCGTGTFIEAVLKNINLRPGSQIIGFEILPVPYALANYRISVLDFSDDIDIEIVLTNTLSDSTFKPVKIEGGSTDIISTIFRNEQKRALALTRPPITIILGNPPCSDAVNISNEGAVIAGLMNDFKPDIRTNRSNSQKQLANEVSKFLRWCLYKAEQSKPSIFALILPASFANNISYKYARKFLSSKVDRLWVLEFDQDNRAGHNSENLFNTLQGRLLLVGALSLSQSLIPSIQYKNIQSLSRTDKEAFFKGKISLSNWCEIELDDNYTFRPVARTDEEMYSKFWYLASTEKPAIFERHCSGLKLAPTHLLVHSDKGQLVRRSKYIADLSHTYTEIKERWYKGQAKPPLESKLAPNVRMALSASSRNILNYSFRPFLTMQLVMDDALMDEIRSTPGGGMRVRPEVQAAYKNNNVFGFAVAPAPSEISPHLEKFTSFCWYLPDNDLATRGNSHIFCNRFPEYKKKSNWNPDIHRNINNALLECLASQYNQEMKDLENEIVFYSYAVLNTPQYLHDFEGKLYSTAGEWPAIPIASDYTLFKEMSRIGYDMANLEKNNSHEIEFSESIFIEYQASTEIIISSYQISDNSISCLDENGNQTLLITAPSEILSFKASGYDVVREWLKYHSYAYFRKTCSSAEILDLMTTLNKVRIFIDLAASANSIFHKIISNQLIEPN